MEEVKDVKLVNAETGEVLLEFDTLKVSNMKPEEEEHGEDIQELPRKPQFYRRSNLYNYGVWFFNLLIICFHRIYNRCDNLSHDWVLGMHFVSSDFYQCSLDTSRCDFQ